MRGLGAYLSSATLRLALGRPCHDRRHSTKRTDLPDATRCRPGFFHSRARRSPENCFLSISPFDERREAGPGFSQEIQDFSRFARLWIDDMDRRSATFIEEIGKTTGLIGKSGLASGCKTTPVLPPGLLSHKEPAMPHIHEQHRFPDCLERASERLPEHSSRSGPLCRRGGSVMRRTLRSLRDRREPAGTDE